MQQQQTQAETQVAKQYEEESSMHSNETSRYQNQLNLSKLKEMHERAKDKFIVAPEPNRISLIGPKIYQMPLMPQMDQSFQQVQSLAQVMMDNESQQRFGDNVEAPYIIA